MKPEEKIELKKKKIIIKGLNEKKKKTMKKLESIITIIILNFNFFKVQLFRNQEYYKHA